PRRREIWVRIALSRAHWQGPVLLFRPRNSLFRIKNLPVFPCSGSVAQTFDIAGALWPTPGSTPRYWGGLPVILAVLREMRSRATDCRALGCSRSARSDQDHHGVGVRHVQRVRLGVEIDVDFTKCSLDRNRMRRRLLEILDQQPRAGQIRGELALLRP